MFLKKFNVVGLLSSLFILGGCADTVVSPVEQVQQVNNNLVVQPKTVSKRSVVKNQALTRYICKGDKEVRVLKSKGKKNGKNTISVTFRGTTYELSPAVTKNGKKYSNIRWIWWEPRAGMPELYNNNKQVLAQACVKQR